MADADTNRLFEVIGELRGMLQSLLARTEGIETETRRAVDGAHARMDKMEEAAAQRTAALHAKIEGQDHRCQAKCGEIDRRISTLEAGQNVAKGGLIVGKNMTLAMWAIVLGAGSLLAWFVSFGFFSHAAK